MTAEKASKRTLVVSLGFAATIVFSSYIFPNYDTTQTATIILITVWLIPFSYVVNAKRRSTQKPLPKKKKEQ